MFNSDKPISNENEDELNRMPFVKRLSNQFVIMILKIVW